MKIALAPDLHCFYNTYSTADNFREKEWDDCVDEMFSACVASKVDVLVAPGDFFTNPRPTAAQVLKVASLFQRFEDAGIKVVGINGNHDIGGSNSSSMNDVVEEIGGVGRWCAKDFGTKIIDGVGFAFLPYMKDAQIVAKNPEFATQLMAERLVEEARKLFLELKDSVSCKILVGHWALSGAGNSRGLSLSAKNEVVIDRSELVRQGWDVCLFGHIHTPQVLEEKPFIAYSGCVQRIAVNEAEDKRLFYIYDTEAKTYESHDLPAIGMASIRGKIEKESDVDAFLQQVGAADVEGKIVQVSYKIVKPLASRIKKKDVAAIVAKKNPLRLIGVIPHIVEPEAARLDFGESVDNATALVKWCEIKGIGKEMQEKLLGIMAEYDKEEQL